MLLLLVMRMLVVLMVLEELVVFVGGIFENVLFPIFLGEIYRIQKENFGGKKKTKNP